MQTHNSSNNNTLFGGGGILSPPKTFWLIPTHARKEAAAATPPPPSLSRSSHAHGGHHHHRREREMTFSLHLKSSNTRNFQSSVEFREAHQESTVQFFSLAQNLSSPFRGLISDSPHTQTLGTVQKWLVGGRSRRASVGFTLPSLSFSVCVDFAHSESPTLQGRFPPSIPLLSLSLLSTTNCPFVGCVCADAQQLSQGPKETATAAPTTGTSGTSTRTASKIKQFVCVTVNSHRPNLAHKALFSPFFL